MCPGNSRLQLPMGRYGRVLIKTFPGYDSTVKSSRQLASTEAGSMTTGRRVAARRKVLMGKTDGGGRITFHI